MDLNHDKQIQSLLCYRYTIGQTGAFAKLKGFIDQSSRQTGGGDGRKNMACGLSPETAFGFAASSGAAKDILPHWILSPLRGLAGCESRYPRLTPWAIICRSFGALSRITPHASRL